MIYGGEKDWIDCSAKRVLLFGMSGLGKTRISDMLRRGAGYFHYSVDYRIGTRYMGEKIADNAKAEAMKVPFLADLLRSDSIKISSNITFNNLAPLSTYLGKPGDPTKGGLRIDEYRRRQDQHRDAEVSSLLDTPYFIERAARVYGYNDFVCDSGGSICEVVDAHDPEDPVLTTLSGDLLMVWIEGGDGHVDELAERFDRDPKPMYYHPDFLNAKWDAYLEEKGVAGDRVDPDAFVRWIYREAMEHRSPLYRAMAEKWGVSVPAADVAAARSPGDVEGLVADALRRRADAPR